MPLMRLGLFKLPNALPLSEERQYMRHRRPHLLIAAIWSDSAAPSYAKESIRGATYHANIGLNTVLKHSGSRPHLEHFFRKK